MANVRGTAYQYASGDEIDGFGSELADGKDLYVAAISQVIPLLLLPFLIRCCEEEREPRTK